MMQGGGGGSNLSCQLLQAASRATPTQVTRPRQQACSQAVGEVGKENKGSPCHINIVDSNDHSHSMRPQRIHHSEDDGDCDSNSANDADVDDDSDDGGKQQRKQVQQQHSMPGRKTHCFACAVGSRDGSCNPQMRAKCAPSFTENIIINTECLCHINIPHRNDHSRRMRRQRIHPSDDDGDCDSNNADDADVDDDNDDGGKQQRRQMPQQHSSTATYTADERNSPSCHVNTVDGYDQSHGNSETNWLSANPLLSWVKARLI